MKTWPWLLSKKPFTTGVFQNMPFLAALFHQLITKKTFVVGALLAPGKFPSIKCELISQFAPDIKFTWVCQAGTNCCIILRRQRLGRSKDHLKPPPTPVWETIALGFSQIKASEMEELSCLHCMLSPIQSNKNYKQDMLLYCMFSMTKYLFQELLTQTDSHFAKMAGAANLSI